MIFTSIERIKANIIERQRPFWKIYQSDGKNLIGESLEVENLNVQKSAELLETELNNLDGKGYVIVRLYSKPTTRGGDNSNAFTYNVRINGIDDNTQNNNINPGGNNIAMITGFYDKINDLNMKLINQEHDYRFKELERKFEDKNKGGNLDPLMKEVLGFAKIALAGSQNKNIPGNNASPIKENIEVANKGINGINDKEEFVNLIKKWNQLDPNYVDAIKAIVYFAETDRAMYDMQVNLLINQYKSK